MASAFREFFRIPRRHRTVTGIDIGARSVKVISLDRSKGGRPKLVYAAKEIVEPGDPNDLPARQAEALKRALGRRGGRLGWVVLAFPRSMTSARIISLPTIQPEEVKEMVRFDAERHVPFQPDEAEISHQILTQHENYTSDVLLVSARRGHLERFLNILDEAGVETDYISVNAVGNIWPFMLEDNDGKTVAVLDVGHRSSDLTIFRNRKIHYSRSLMMGTGRLEEYLANEGHAPDTAGDATTWDFGRNGQFDETAEEKWIAELVPELRRTFQAFRHEPQGSAVDRIIVCGGLAHAEGLEEKLLEELGIETRAARNVLPPQVLAPKLDSLDPEMAGAVGATLSVLDSGPGGVNLLPQGILESRRREHTRGFIRQVVTLIVMALLLGGGILYNNYNLLQKKIAFYQAAVDELAPKISEAQTMKEEIQILDSLRDQEVTAYRVLEDLYRRTPDNIQIEDLRLEKARDERDDDTLSMVGKAPAPQNTHSYVESLLESPYIRDAELGEVRATSEYGIPLVRFKLTAYLVESPGRKKEERRLTAARGR
jgi:type IV pilus assembly protein PilM